MLQSDYIQMLRTYQSARRASCVPIRILLQRILSIYHPPPGFLGKRWRLFSFFSTKIKEQEVVRLGK